MDEINQENFKELLNKRITVEARDKVYTGRLVHVDARHIKLKPALGEKRVVTISIGEIDAVMYQIAQKRVGY